MLCEEKKILVLLHCTARPTIQIGEWVQEASTQLLKHGCQRGLCGGGEVGSLVLSVFACGRGRQKVSLARLHLGSRRGEGRRREEGERARGEVSAKHGGEEV